MNMYYAIKERITNYRGRKAGPTIANNTVAYMSGEAVIVRLHETEIVRLYPAGECVIKSGGWRTVTTKRRINDYTPARLYQHNHVWYVHNCGDPVFFQDDMLLDSSGRVLDAPGSDAAARAEERRINERIDAYIRKLAELPELPLPSAGDCIGCQFDMTTDCIPIHLEECYVHGSLILRALKARGWPERSIKMAFVRNYLRSQVTLAVRMFLYGNARGQ